MIQSAVSIYELSKKELLVKKTERSSMHEVVEKIEKIMSMWTKVVCILEYCD